MAVANVAADLATRNGKRVLVIDWDLEAPGLHYYFGKQDKNLKDQPGLIDFLEDASNTLTDPETRKRLKLSNYVVKGALKHQGARVDLMTCGKTDDRYVSRVEAFDWENFYRQRGGFAAVEKLRRDALESYDIVLVDARSGHSDSAVLATLQMPELVVMLFTANEQSLAGTADIARRLRSQPTRAEWGRQPLRFVFVPARIFANSARVESWLGGPAHAMATSLEKAGILERSLQPRGLRQFLLQIEPDASVGETILNSMGTESLALQYAYARIADLIIQLARGDIDWRMEAFVPYSTIAEEADSLRKELHETVKRGDEHTAHLLRLSLSKLLLRADHAGYFGQVLAMLPGAYSYFLSRDDTRNAAVCCMLLGRAEYRSGNLDLAHEYLEEALRLARSLKDLLGEAIIRHDLGNIYFERADRSDRQYQRALDEYNQSLELKLELSEYSGAAITLHKIGSVYFNISDYERAEAAFRASHRYASQAGDMRSQAIALHSLGNLYGQRKLNGQAIEFFEQALALQDEKTNPQGQAITYRRLGDCWRHSATGVNGTIDQEAMAKAIGYYEQSLALASRIEDAHNEQMLYSRLAECYRNLGKIADARLAYQQALGLGRVEQHPGGLAEVYVGLAELEFENHTVREGTALLQAAERELKASRDGRIERRVREKIDRVRAKYAAKAGEN